MLAQGSYQAVAKEFVFGRAGNGTEQVVVSFEIASGESAGQRISWRGFFTEKTCERTLESLEYAGWDGVSLARLAGLGSKPCVIVVEHEDGQDGKTYAKVQWVNSLGGGLSVKEKMQSAEIAELEERMRGIMLDRASKRPAQPSQRSQSKQSGQTRGRGFDDDDYGPGGDDDIPF